MEPEPATLAALAEPTRRRVYEHVLAAAGPVGRDEIAGALGIGRPLAAFHLEKLVGAGLLVAEYRRLTGRTGPGAGRPAKLYRRSALELELSVPPRRYGLAAELFAEALAEDAAADGDTSAPDRLLPIAAERGRAAGTSARATRGEAGWHDALRAAGYEPVPESGRVRLRNCPYADVARDHRDLMCPANQAFLDGFAAGFGRPEAAVLRLDRPEGGCCVTFEARAALGAGGAQEAGVSQTG
jgi:predicted ArsR family transcriptional regulator